MAQPEKKPGGESTYIVGAILLFAIGWLIWTKGRPVVVVPLFAVDWAEYWILYHIGLLKDHIGLGWFRYVDGVIREPHYAFQVEWQDIMDVQSDCGGRMRWPISVLIFVFAVFTIFTMKGHGFKKVYSLSGKAFVDVTRIVGIEVKPVFLVKFLTATYKFFLFKWLAKIIITLTGLRFLVKTKKEWVNKGTSFMHFQSQEWKVVLASAHFDPDKLSEADLPQKSPMEWIRDNNISLQKGVYDEEAATRVFEDQLGPTWSGIEKAPYYVQAICILAALNASNDKGIKAFRSRLSEIHVLNPTKAEAETRKLMAPFLAKKNLVDSINARGRKHAYQNTATIAIFAAGGPFREWGGGMTGVLSTSMIRWLKTVDRKLWYCLNNVGRRGFHIEGAGAIGHFFAERIHGQALVDAFMEPALQGLDDYVKENNVDNLQSFFRAKATF